METITEKHFEKPELAKPQAKIVKFVNFTDEDFTWSYNKVPYTFKAGEVKFMSEGIARHFAKHLVNRELHRRGRENDTSPKTKNGVSDNPFFNELMDQCIQDVPIQGEADEIKLEQEAIDMQVKSQGGKVKGGKKKEMSSEIEAPKEKGKKEKEFEDLPSDIGED